MISGPVIYIEGIIGAGKTTLAKKIAEGLGIDALYEPVNSNLYLKPFYDDPKRWAFAMQIHLLHYRYALQKKAAYGATLGMGAVLDRGMPGDRVFCKLHTLSGNISEMEWGTYQMAYEVMACSLVPPSFLLFLDVEPDVALERIKERSRDAETTIDLKYLTDLRKGYLDLMAEIESGEHIWSRGMEVKRLPWNSDYLPIEPLIDELKHKYRL